MKIITEGEKSKFVEFKSAEISAEDFNKAFESKKVKKYDLDGNKFVVVKDDETDLFAVYCLENGATTAKMVTRYELNKEKGITIYYTAAGEKTQEFATFESDLAKEIANARITRDGTAKASEDAKAVKALVDEWVKETKPVVEAYDAAMAKVAENIIIFDLIYKWVEEIKSAVSEYEEARDEFATVSKSIEDGERKAMDLGLKAEEAVEALIAELHVAGLDISGENSAEKLEKLQAILEPVNGKDISQRFEGALRVTAKNEEQVLAQVESFKKVLAAYESARKEMDDNDKQLEADRKIKNDCERELAQKAEALKKANAESKNIEELKKHESIQAKIEELLRGNADEQSKAFKDLPEYENKKFEDAQEEGADAWRKLDARKPDSKKGLMADLKGFDSIKEAIRDLFAKNAKVNRADLLTAVQKSAQDVWDKAFDAKTKADDAYVEEKIDLDRILEGVVAQEKYDALYRSVKGFLPILREEIKLGKTQPDGIVEFGYAGKDGKEEKACIFLAPAPEVEWASKYERFNGKLKEYVFFGTKRELLKGLFEDKSAVLHNAQVINMVISNDHKKDEKFKAAIAYYLDTTIVNGQFQEGTRGVRYISRDSVGKIRAAHEAYVRMHSSFVDNRDLVVEGSMKYRAETSKIPGADEYKNRKLVKAVTAVLLAGLAAGTAITGVFHYNAYIKEPSAIELENAQRQTALAELEDESDKARTYGINQGSSKEFGVAYDKDGEPVYSNLPGLADVQIYTQQNTGDAGTLTPEENQNLDKKFGYTEATQDGFAYGLGQAIAQKLAEDGLLELKRIGTDGTETNTYYFDEATLAEFDEGELKAGYDSVLEDLEIGGNSVIAEGIDPTNSDLINAAEDKVKDGIVSVVKDGKYAYAFSEDGQTAYRIQLTDAGAKTTADFVDAVKNGQYEQIFTSAAALFKSDKAFWQDKYISGIEYSTTKVGKVEYFVVDESGVTTKKTADAKWIGASAIPNDKTMMKVAIAANEGNKTISIKGASDVDASEIVESLKPVPAAQADEGMGLGD